MAAPKGIAPTIMSKFSAPIENQGHNELPMFRNIASWPFLHKVSMVAVCALFTVKFVWTGRRRSGCRCDHIGETMAMAATSGRQSAAVAQCTGEAFARKAFDLNPPRGSRDFYPSDMRLRSWLFGHFRRVAQEFGFEEYDAPVLENEELYIRKAGEEVSQQLYNFEDKGGRRLSLRPEMTPSLARMVLARRGALPATLKWFSIPQCWRYERMTRGRRREHYQWNMDIWGVAGVEAEVELLAAAVKCLRDMGLTSNDVGIKVNNRKVLTELMSSLSVPQEKFAATCVLIDKLEKVPFDALEADMENLGVARETVKALLGLVQDASLESLEERLGASSAGLQEIKRIYELAAGYGIADWLVFNASVVRGLAYYTGTVFEGFDRSGQLRAIFGGGRYDKLLETFGGAAMPAVGFGFGDAVIIELLKMKSLLPTTDSSSVAVVVFPMEERLRVAAMGIAEALRAVGIACDLVLDPDRKTKWAFKYADRLSAKALVLLAPEEAARDEVAVKRLSSGEQFSVKLSEVVQVVQPWVV
eukprot:GGOE01041878.1.p1 GENE.GGOE01041878.1~~GGOE01041878.1.p1  ORF type:complete len:573 (-),score=99.26 GGOE01041878.1:198-1787(-)